MEEKESREMVEEVVDTAIVKLKLSGLIKDGGRCAYEIESVSSMWENAKNQKGLCIRSKRLWSVVYNPVQATS